MPTFVWPSVSAFTNTGCNLSMKTSSKQSGAGLQPARQDWTPTIVAAVIALIAVFIVYGPALNGPFLLDDTTLPYMQPGYATAPLVTWMRGLRPILMLTYWLNFQSSGAATGSYHFVNIVLHLCNGILIFLSFGMLLCW